MNNKTNTEREYIITSIELNAKREIVLHTDSKWLSMSVVLDNHVLDYRGWFEKYIYVLFSVLLEW